MLRASNLKTELFDRYLKHNGLTSVPNVRIRGKIRQEEWPRIAVRYQKGESLTDIARSYRCTAPAIRYIVKRLSSRSMKGRSLALDHVLAPNRVPSAVPLTALAGNPSEPQKSDLWDSINSELATYLAVMDSVATDESDSSYRALLAATDQLLRAMARTRLALDRFIAGRKNRGATRRVTG